MPDGFDFSDVSNVLKQLKDRVGPSPENQPQQWSIWDRPQTRELPAQTGDNRPPGPGQFQPRSDMQLPQLPGFPQIQLDQRPQVRPEAQVQLRPEQMLGTNHADDRTKQAVFSALSQAQNQSYRSQSARFYQQAVMLADRSQDGSLQAVAKVEYGLANMSWGHSQEGFRLILEAGSNNPTIYDSRTNQSFLERLSQVGMPQSAVDLLLRNGQQDPNWYLKDADATRKLDAAMTGPAFVAPPANDRAAPGPGDDPFLPPKTRPEQLNPDLNPPEPGRAGGWIHEQFKQTLSSASQQRDFQSAFALYKQATDMADRSRDPSLQATARVETGLALLSAGNTENGIKWLLDAGSKNPALYDQRYNQNYIKRLESFGLPPELISTLMTNGSRDPHWHMLDQNAAKNLDAILRKPKAPPPEPIVPNPLLPYTSPFSQPVDKAPAPQPQIQPHLRKSPFGG